MQSERPILIIAAVFIAVLLIGEVIVYSADEKYSAEVTRTAGGLEWSISSSGSNTYEILVFDNGTSLSQNNFYFYLDENYGYTSTPGKQPVGSKALHPEHYLSLLEKELKYRGIDNIEYVDAERLAEVLSNHTESEKSALIMVSGSIPDTVYGGRDILTEWVRSGGTLYWAGGIIGETISHRDGSVDIVTDGPSRILGADCVNSLRAEGDENAGLVDAAINDNDLQKLLGIGNNSVLYAVDANRLGSIPHLSLGFTDGTYASVTYIQSERGQICVLGGDLTHEQNSDLSQLVASGISYQSTLVASESGEIFGTNINGTLAFASPGNIRVYIFLGHGADYPVFGRGFDI